LGLKFDYEGRIMGQGLNNLFKPFFVEVYLNNTFGEKSF